MDNTETDLIVRTFEVMEPGDSLMLSGGTFPGEGEQAVVQLNIEHIIPYMNVFNTAVGNRDGINRHPARDNPLGIEGRHIEETLRRGQARFKFDNETPEFRVATKLGLLGEIEVDMIAIGPNLRPAFYFVTKPRLDS